MNDMTEKEPGFIKIKMEMEFALLFIGESVYRVAGSVTPAGTNSNFGLPVSL